MTLNLNIINWNIHQTYHNKGLFRRRWRFNLQVIFRIKTIALFIKRTKIRIFLSQRQKIFVLIFSQNRELSSFNEDIAEKIKVLKSLAINNSVNDPEYINYLEKIGFYP